MLNRILDFIVEYILKFGVVEQYLNIIDRTKMLYNRNFTHNAYLDLANVTLNELRSVHG